MPNQYRKGTTVITLRLPSALKDNVQRLAASRRTTVNGLIRDVLQRVVASEPESNQRSDPRGASADFTQYLRRIRDAAQAHRTAMAERHRRGTAVAATVADATMVSLVGSMSRADEAIGWQATSTSSSQAFRGALRVAAERLAGGEFSVDLILVEDLNAEAQDLFFRKGIPLQ